MPTLTRRAFPEVRTGYELNPCRGYFSIVVPEATLNLVSNPSLEINATGYTAWNGAALARTAAEQRRGAYGLAVTPSVLPNDGVYYSPVSLTAGSAYTFSLDFKGAGGGRVYDLLCDLSRGAARRSETLEGIRGMGAGEPDAS